MPSSEFFAISKVLVSFGSLMEEKGRYWRGNLMLMGVWWRTGGQFQGMLLSSTEVQSPGAQRSRRLSPCRWLRVNTSQRLTQRRKPCGFTLLFSSFSANPYQPRLCFWTISLWLLSRKNISITLIQNTLVYDSTLTIGLLKKEKYKSSTALPKAWLQRRSQKHYHWQKSSILRVNFGSYQSEGECWKDRRCICGQTWYEVCAHKASFFFAIYSCPEDLCAGNSGFRICSKRLLCRSSLFFSAIRDCLLPFSWLSSVFF